mmetsp:Transcript_27009/g.71110  ORF Transcript_27009/g.71110 Transcript_27009/m.71110 type:complete len:248 (-) Transcript_27009:5147-5890(-)
MVCKLHVQLLAFANRAHFGLQSQRSVLGRLPLEFHGIFTSVQDANGLDPRFVDVDITEIDTVGLTGQRCNRASLPFDGNMTMRVETLSLDIDRKPRCLLFHIANRIEVVVLLQLRHELDCDRQLGFGSNGPRLGNNLKNRRVLISSVRATVKSKCKRNVLLVNEFHNLVRLVIEQFGREIAESVVKEDVWLLDVTHQNERDFNAVFWNFESPERFHKHIRIRGVFKHHLRFLPAQNNAVLVNTLENA